MGGIEPPPFRGLRLTAGRLYRSATSEHYLVTGFSSCRVPMNPKNIRKSPVYTISITSILSFDRIIYNSISSESKPLFSNLAPVAGIEPATL